MSVLVYDCGSVENTVTAILDTESGAMIIRGNGDIDNYADESNPWYSEHSDILQVTVDKGVTRIGSGTFYGCENLSFVEIASTVTSIGADVFQNCTSLTSIKIPKNITDIGNGTFTDSGLTEVKFYGNPPTVGTDIFDGVTADVYTPEGNEEWTETVKGTVAGNGSNLTWKEFDSKPNLIEYDELDYLWSKIKKYVDNNVSVTQVVSSGTKIATITVNGVDTDIYSSGGLSGTVGSSTTPIYIDNGVPTACGGSLAVDITGNAATATKATQDDSGNTITSTYATIAKTYDDTTNTSYRGMRGLDGSTSGWVRTTTSGIIPSQSGAAGSGHCGLGTSSWYFATAYIDNIYGKLNGNCTGSSGSCTGNAATATSATSATTATNANNAKLTHTVGNTEYPLVFGTSFVITDAQQALRIGTPTATAANCALRAKAYCAAANTQGEAYLVCGNNIALASANNSRGSIYLYGTNTGNTRILPGNNTTSNITLTLPSSTGTIALTSSNITGSSASCTGNAATATTASACSGNSATATTATNANNLKVTHTGAAWRDILSCATGFTSASNQAVYGHNSGSVAYYVDANATSGNQRAILRLGNATANTTAAGHNGQIYMYGTSTGYTIITPGYNSTSSVTITLPAKTGTVALTSDLASFTLEDDKTLTYYRIFVVKHTSGLRLGWCLYLHPGTAPSSDETYTFKTAFTNAHLYSMGSDSTGEIGQFKTYAAYGNGRAFQGKTTVANNYLASQTKLSTTKLLLNKDSTQGCFFWGY